jgi:dUTP pyrophosphatase
MDKQNKNTIMDIKVTVVDNTVKKPVYSTEGAAGFDLFAHTFKSVTNPGEALKKEDANVESINLYPGARVLVGTGIHMAIPTGYEVQVRPRSGNAIKKGLTVLNSPGTIDSDYRGEVGVILINHSKDAVTITKGDAIAQGVLKQVERANFVKVDELPSTERGQGGFGSTDKK